MPSTRWSYTLQLHLWPSSSFNSWRHIFPPHGGCQAIDSSCLHLCWPVRSYAMILTPTSHGDHYTGNIPVERNQPNEEINVPVFGVGIECRSSDIEGVQTDGMQGFCRLWPLLNLYPSTNEEVIIPTALHYSLHCHPLLYQSITIQWETVLLDWQSALKTHYLPPSMPQFNSPLETLSLTYSMSSPASSAPPSPQLALRIFQQRLCQPCHWGIWHVSPIKSKMFTFASLAWVW